MECAHLSSPVDSKIFAFVEGKAEFTCDVCQAAKSTWMCLYCGVFKCGRYMNGHSLEHYRKNPRHSVVIDCETMATYCYECDDYAVIDSLVPNIAKLRDKLLAKNDSSPMSDHASDSSNDGFSKPSLGRNTRKRHASPENIDDTPSSNLGCGVENRKNIKKDIKAVPRHLRSSGLRNLGNTCFMNAVLQSLSNLPHFCRYFKQLPALDETIGGKGGKVARRFYHTRRNNYGDDILLSEEVRKILIELWAGSKTAISPDSLFNVIWKVVPRFRGFQQQDAHEFLCYILDRLHSELLNILPYLSLSDSGGKSRRLAATTSSSSSAADTAAAAAASAEQQQQLDHLVLSPSRQASKLAAQAMSNSKSTIVTAIFGGVLQSEVMCLVCGSESKKHDPFLDLSINIPYYSTHSGGSSTSESGGGSSSRSTVAAAASNGSGAAAAATTAASAHSGSSTGSTTQAAATAATASAAASNAPNTCELQDCLKSFTELEVLSETELYHCGPCKKKQRSTKKFCIRRLPNVLCIHLKRFRWCNSYRQKVNTHVDFPVTGLDMSVYMLENMPETRGISASGNLYDLAAIIVHHGSGAGSGHYTAYAFNGGNWYHFNDSSVSIVDEDTVRKCKAYILFYIRRKIKLPDMTIH